MYITIIVDQNDADYAELTSKIDSKTLESIKPLIKQISEFKPYKATVKGSTWDYNNNFPYNGIFIRTDLGEKTVKELYNVTDELLELFRDLCPITENGFHSIVSVEVFDKINVKKLLEKK